MKEMVQETTSEFIQSKGLKLQTWYLINHTKASSSSLPQYKYIDIKTEGKCHVTSVFYDSKGGSQSNGVEMFPATALIVFDSAEEVTDLNRLKELNAFLI